MASCLGKNLVISLDGSSHGPYVQVVIKGLKIGETFDKFMIEDLLERRRPKHDFESGRVEDDEIVWEGVSLDYDTYTVTSDTIVAKILNKDIDSSKYEEYRITPRPGHVDYPLLKKDSKASIVGSGKFSGRMTVGLVVAGGIALQLLERRGISISTEILEIGKNRNPDEFEEVCRNAKENNDSVGGIIKVDVYGVKAGEIGDSYFDGVDSKIANAIFGIPAIKGISFGAGFRASRMFGSEHNDPYYFDANNVVRTRTNNHGGLIGGISTGMPIWFTVSVKPTPSIPKEQNTVNLKNGIEDTLEIVGRHDSCIALRMPPILEAVTALVILDEIMESERVEEVVPIHKEHTINYLRSEIDKENKILLEAFERRLNLAKEIGDLKKKENLPIVDTEREYEILEDVRENSDISYAELNLEFFKKIIELTKSAEVETLDFEEEIVTIEEETSEEPYGLLGIEIENSLSPFIHETIGEISGDNYGYSLHNIELDEFDDFLRNNSFEGLNITMPYKREVISYLDELTDLAEDIGSVNTIFFRNGKLIGDNTDYYGIIHSLKVKGIDIKGKSCLIFGDGGASDSLYVALKDLGAGKVTRLSHEDINHGKQDLYMDYQVIINATPVGKGRYEGESLVDLDSFINCKLIMDLNYSPLNTKLIQDGKLRKIKCINGLDMLITQAVCSYEDFFNVDLRDDVREEYIDEIRRRILLTKNIVLIGMPGCGKTTIGQALASYLGKDFYDTDEMIEYREGINAKDIIEQYGENYFREKERETCIVLSQVKNSVIATGGGTILSDENYYNLTKDAVVIYLKKDLDLLNTYNRPLSKDLLKLYSERTSSYDSWKDMDVHCEYREVQEIIEEIVEKIDIK